MKSYAIYLPQFHPIPENNEWWGEGFTEWNNVVRGKPAFENHHQPHLPADLGFYDLRLPEVREAQARLAAEYRIDGFIYYHYWFSGKRLLERPFNDVLNSGKPDLPFALCWANEDWRRNWDGSTGKVLMPQQYSEEDDRAHILWLIEAFKDERYIRIDDKPLFSVYRSKHLPNIKQTLSIWREEADRAGIGELFLARIESFEDEHDDPAQYGFDASIEFAPDWSLLQEPDEQYLPRRVFEYGDFANDMLAKPDPGWRRFPCVTPQWDNSVRRRDDGLILVNSSPDKYQEWVLRTLDRESLRIGSKDATLFVSAWNEWGEGNHLEPDQKWGLGYLDAHRDAVKIFESAEHVPGVLELELPSSKLRVMNKPKLSVILLSNRGSERCDAALDSIWETCSESCNVNVIVIDNAGTYVQPVENRRLEILSGSPEDPAAQSWSQGLANARGKFVLLMTSDIILSKGWLEEALRAYDSDPSCMAVSPSLKQGTTTVLSQAPASGSGVCILADLAYLSSGQPLSVSQARKSFVRWEGQASKRSSAEFENASGNSNANA